jgi:hypothetical protein
MVSFVFFSDVMNEPLLRLFEKRFPKKPRPKVEDVYALRSRASGVHATGFG